MRTLKNSDLFSGEINKNNVILGRINAILSGMEPAMILNETLYPEIKKKIVDKRRTEIMNDMLTCIQNGRMILFITQPDKRLSDVIPFFVYKQDGLRKVCVNLTSVINTNRNPGDGSLEYEMGDSLNKIYVMLYAAYLALDRFEEHSVLTPDMLYHSAVIWAEMFTKPLFNTIGLNNSDRRVAFMYFSIQFFLGYFMDCPEDQIHSISMRYVGRKNELILYMEEKLHDKQINISRDGLIGFLYVLFDNEITMIKGLRVKMNVSFYLNEYVKTYGSNALLALCNYSYFVYVILAAYNKTKMLKDKSFDRIFQNNTREVNKFMVELLKD